MNHNTCILSLVTLCSAASQCHASLHWLLQPSCNVSSCLETTGHKKYWKLNFVFADSLVMQIFAEILPRLGCVNVSVLGCVLQADQIKCVQENIWVGEEEFSVPGLEFALNSISGVTFSPEVVVQGF